MAKRKPLDLYTLSVVSRQLLKRANQLTREGFSCQMPENRLMLFATSEELGHQARDLREQARALKPAKRTERR